MDPSAPGLISLTRLCSLGLISFPVQVSCPFAFIGQPAPRVDRWPFPDALRHQPAVGLL